MCVYCERMYVPYLKIIFSNDVHIIFTHHSARTEENTVTGTSSTCVCVCVYTRVCGCVDVFEMMCAYTECLNVTYLNTIFSNNLHIIFTHHSARNAEITATRTSFTHVCVCVSVCVCVCVCVCVNEGVFVLVCMRECVYCEYIDIYINISQYYLDDVHNIFSHHSVDNVHCIYTHQSARHEEITAASTSSSSMCVSVCVCVWVRACFYFYLFLDHIYDKSCVFFTHNLHIEYIMYITHHVHTSQCQKSGKYCHTHLLLYSAGHIYNT